MNKNGKFKMTGNQFLIGLVVVVLLGLVVFFATKQPATATTVENGIVKATGTPQTIACPQNPAMTYSGKDKFSTTSLTGTDVIIQGDSSYVSSLANPKAGENLLYWISNSSVFVDPVSTIVECGSGQTLQAVGYLNATVTLAAYDLPSRTAIASATHNLTIGAGDSQSVELSWKSTGSKANMPFGGCACLEFPATMDKAQTSLTGAGIKSTECTGDMAKTYSVSSTSNTFKCYEVEKGFDGYTTATLKTLNVDLVATSTVNPSGTAYVKFYPANYYTTNDGKLALGVEKVKNGASTVTFSSANSITLPII